MSNSHLTSDDYRRTRIRGSDLILDDGRRLHVRPIRPDDRARLSGLFARLGPESRYRRFLWPKRRLEYRELDYLTRLDYVGHDALVAIDRDGSIAGVARYARDRSRPAAAHIAVAVADDLHGLGIGSALAGLIVKRARANGYELLIATTVWENTPARALLRRLGFRARGSDHGAIELQLVLRPAPS